MRELIVAFQLGLFDDAEADTAYGEALADEVSNNEAMSAMHALAEQIDALYSSDAAAPSRWQDKPALRTTLRQKVRHMLLEADVSEWKGIPEKVEKFARKHYAKV